LHRELNATLHRRHLATYYPSCVVGIAKPTNIPTTEKITDGANEGGIDELIADTALGIPRDALLPGEAPSNEDFYDFGEARGGCSNQ
jgi:hypothetical protein